MTGCGGWWGSTKGCGGSWEREREREKEEGCEAWQLFDGDADKDLFINYGSSTAFRRPADGGGGGGKK